MAQTLKSYLTQFRADDLNDEAGEVYSLEQLAAYRSDASRLLRLVAPDQFIEYTTVKLVAGAIQTVPGRILRRVVSQVDAKGNMLADFGGTPKPNRRVWPGTFCGTTGGYRLQKVTVDKHVNGSFVVQPAVPAGVDVWVVVAAMPAVPCDLGLNGPVTDCEFSPLLHHYMMWRALSSVVDPTAVRAASASMAAFTGLLAAMTKGEMNAETIKDMITSEVPSVDA